MKKLFVVYLAALAIGSLSTSNSTADIVNVTGSSAISATASVTRGGSGETDGFSNQASPATGTAGVVESSYFALAGPVIENPPTSSFPGTNGIAQSSASASVDFTLPGSAIELNATTLGEILATDGPGINAGYVADNNANARIDFEVDQSTAVRLGGSATHSTGAFWQIQVGGGSIASNYFSSSLGETRAIDDIYTFDPGFTYFIRVISDADLSLQEGDNPQSRSSSVSIRVAAVPEPNSLGILALGAGLIGLFRRFRIE